MHRNAKESPSPMFLIFPDAESLAEHVSATLVDQIAKKPEIVLGLATGGTMEPVYRRFVEQVKRQAVDLSKFRSFNLDEYVGLAADHPKSYAAYMYEHLFRHIGHDPARHFLPDGLAPDLSQHCRDFAQMIRQCGGIDLQLLGVGTNGHIGFNEPGTPLDSRCHVVALSERTRIDNSRFFPEGAIVPATAITMGLQDIMEARRILLLATGQGKAETVAAFHDSDVTPDVPVTVLKRHPDATIMLDAAAASLLPPDVRERCAASAAMCMPLRRYA